jgi:dipeptidyl aminopeptidase/acylaminoacyl peptidase
MQTVKYPDVWTAAIAWGGKTDLLLLEQLSSVHKGRELLGDPFSNEDAWTDQSPISHVEDFSGPLLILHGTQDWTEPPEQARQFRDALIDAGFQPPHDFHYYEFADEGHTSRSQWHRERTWRIIKYFLDHRL